MADTTFDIMIARVGERYTMRAALSQHELIGPLPFDLPFDLAALSRQRADVAGWVRQAAVPRRGAAEEVRRANELGGALFEHLFVPDLRLALRSARDGLAPGERLRLSLRLPPELEAVPWELLYDAERRTRLALDPRLGLVRRPALIAPPPPLRVDGPLKVVAVAASPSDPELHEIKAEYELRRLEDALRELRDQGRVDLDLVRGHDTLGRLRGRLRYPQHNPVHILHVVCHGQVDADEGVLLFEDAEGDSESVTADYLQTLLAWQEGLLRLVVLNACQGAVAVEADPLGSVAAALLRAGVPAVVAMQFDIPDDAARELTRVFYGSVVAGTSVDLALTEARQHLFHTFRGRLDWAVPVLYLREGDGVLFEGAQSAERRAQSRGSLPVSTPPEATSDNAIANIPSTSTPAEPQQHTTTPAPSPARQPATSAVPVKSAVPREPASADLPQQEAPLSSSSVRTKAEEAVQVLADIEQRLARNASDREALAAAVRLIEDGRVPLVQRLAAGRLLGTYGDLRPGVCALPKGLDDAYWSAELPAGSYAIGTQRDPFNNQTFQAAKLHLGAFRIGRYPVTVWQYRQFVEAKGYEERRWWTEQGWGWRKAETRPYQWDKSGWTADNQPLSGVSWYEAMAFSTWLDAQVTLPKGWTIRLPSEAEWEVAAMWDAGQNTMRPWASPANEFWQNVKEVGVGCTTPVGVFQQGTSPCGALDMAGNVWEWCDTSFGGYPGRSGPDHLAIDYSGNAFIQLANWAVGGKQPSLRGGSFYTKNARSGWGARYWYNPNFQTDDWSFRVIVCSAPLAK